MSAFAHCLHGPNDCKSVFSTASLKLGKLQMRGVHITLRMRLFCEVFRDGKPMEGQQYEVLNEVVVDRGANPYLTKIECYEQGRLITKACPCLCQLFGHSVRSSKHKADQPIPHQQLSVIPPSPTKGFDILHGTGHQLKACGLLLILQVRGPCTCI